MTEIPELCPLPKDAFERQRALLGVHVASELHRSPRRRWRVVAIAVAIVVGGLARHASVRHRRSPPRSDRGRTCAARRAESCVVARRPADRFREQARRQGAVRHERRRKRPEDRGARRATRHACLVARRARDRLRGGTERRLRRERRRQRAAEVGAQRKRSCLVARRAANRVREHHQALRRERRRKRAPDSDAAEGSGGSLSLLHGRPTGGSSSSSRSTCPPPAAPSATASVS